LYRGEGT